MALYRANPTNLRLPSIYRAFTCKHGSSILARRSSGFCDGRKISRQFAPKYGPHTMLARCFHTTSSRCADNYSDDTYVMNSSANSFSRSLEQCKTFNDVLNIIETSQCNSLDAEGVTSAISTIMEMFYDSLYNIPWMQRNKDIAFIQLLLSRQLEPRSSVIWDHAGMKDLMAHMENTCEKMTTGQLYQSLLRLIYMGMYTVPQQVQALARLLFLCQDRIPGANLHELSILTGINARMFMHDWTSIMMELRRFSEIMSDDGLELSPSMAVDAGHIILNCISVPLANHNLHIVQPVRRLIARIEQGGCLEEPDHISMYLRLARKLFMHSNGDQIPARHLISLASDACIKHVNHFDNHNIAEACAALRQSRCFSRELMSLFCARSVELLNEDSKLSDVSNLFYAISRNTDLEIKKMFESALFQRMQEVDIVLLSNLAENFVTVNVNNEELLRLIHEHIAFHAEGLAAYNTRFNKVVRLLLRKPFKDPEHESKFTQSVLAQFDKQLKMSNLAMFCVYLLPSTKTALDDDIFNRIVKAIPKLKSYDHHRMALAINQIRNPGAKFRKQIATLQSVLHEWIILKSDEVQTLDYLYQLTQEMVINNRKRDPTLTVHFMEMFPRFTKSMTDVGMTKVLNVFNELCYYMPEVYDDITAFALENEFDSERLTFLLSSLARVNYTPARFDELVERLMPLFDEYGRLGHLRNQILLIKNLNLLNVYPEDKLSYIFSIDYIEKVDTYILENPRLRNEVEKAMMVLNRNVVLECPQLDIPWFHEQFINNQFKPESDRVSFAQKFKDEVEKVLLDPELLDNTDNMRRWIQSPYGYNINFEFILDGDKNPVPVAAYDERALPTNMQRVAVLTLAEQSYTYNLRRLLGQEQIRWRHLEILGYKVIDVPYFEWYSMGLSEYMAKVEYLSSKIFDS